MLRMPTSASRSPGFTSTPRPSDRDFVILFFALATGQVNVGCASRYSVPSSRAFVARLGLVEVQLAVLPERHVRVVVELDLRAAHLLGAHRITGFQRVAGLRRLPVISAGALHLHHLGVADERRIARPQVDRQAAHLDVGSRAFRQLARRYRRSP